jgi:3-methyladenine DNA glycosylase AlkD
VVPADLKGETQRILATYQPQRADDAAAALQALWSQVPLTEGGARLVKAEIRKEPENYLSTMKHWIEDPNKWVRRAGITVVARLPMKRPEYTETCLRLVEPALGDDDLDVRRALSFALRMGARGEPEAVVDFIMRQAHRTDAASIWVLCDVMRSMTKELLPRFKELLPLYEHWLELVETKSRKSVASAIKALRSV